MNNYELRISRIISKYDFLITANRNIVGVGLGNKVIKGLSTDIPCLIFYVKQKMSELSLGSKNVIPKYFNGAITDVIEVRGYSNDKITSRRDNGYNRSGLNDRLSRPVRSGELIKNEKEAYQGGTLGYILNEKDSTKAKPGNKYVLSTSRVLTGNFLGDIGENIIHMSKITEPLTQPLGPLSKIEKMKIYRTPGEDKNPVYNLMDAGFAYVESAYTNGSVWNRDQNNYKVDKGLWDGTEVIGTATIQLGSKVIVSTRRSGNLKGVVQTIKLTTSQDYKNNTSTSWAYFKDQISVDMPGVSIYDYGAVGLFESENNTYKIFGLLVGHLSAGGPIEKNTKVFFTPIETVLKALDKRLMVNFTA